VRAGIETRPFREHAAHNIDVEFHREGIASMPGDSRGQELNSPVRLRYASVSSSPL